METKQLKNIVEAALLSAARPLELNEILRVFEEDERPERKAMLQVMDELTADYEGRALELKKVASGYRLQVRKDFSPWLGRIVGQRVPRYSRALLETLALVAYRQPVTRGEIENVRGVSVSSNIVRTLLERGWVRIVGHRDVPGRPAMLGTTKEFLDYFNLQSLDELPSLAELKDLDSINVELDFDGPPLLPAPAAGIDDIGDDDRPDSGGDILAELEATESAAEELAAESAAESATVDAAATTTVAEDEAPDAMTQDDAAGDAEPDDAQDVAADQRQPVAATTAAQDDERSDEDEQPTQLNPATG